MLAGHATLVTGGYTRGCEDVVLLPVTPEVDKRFAQFGDLNNDRFIDEFTLRRTILDDEVQRFRYEVECAKDGAFLFQNVPAGQYLLIARVTRSVRWARHGGYVVREITAAVNTTGLNISIVKDNA